MLAAMNTITKIMVERYSWRILILPSSALRLARSLEAK